MNERFICKVCGLIQDDPPWGIDGKSPTFNYCDCCGVEFGYGDANEKAVENWRNTWIHSGAKWDRPESMPDGWNIEDQLKNLPDIR